MVGYCILHLHFNVANDLMINNLITPTFSYLNFIIWVFSCISCYRHEVRLTVFFICRPLFKMCCSWVSSSWTELNQFAISEHILIIFFVLVHHHQNIGPIALVSFRYFGFDSISIWIGQPTSNRNPPLLGLFHVTVWSLQITFKSSVSGSTSLEKWHANSIIQSNFKVGFHMWLNSSIISQILHSFPSLK